MNKTQIFLAAFILVIMSALVFIPASSVGAADAIGTVCDSNPGESAVCTKNDTSSSGNFIGAIVNTLLFIVGAVSVISIIIGGILYVLSSGDSSNITKAKNTIVYAIVGLIAAFLAYAIVNWVFNVF